MKTPPQLDQILAEMSQRAENARPEQRFHAITSTAALTHEQALKKLCTDFPALIEAFNALLALHNNELQENQKLRGKGDWRVLADERDRTLTEILKGKV